MPGAATAKGGAGNDSLNGWGTMEGGTGDDVMGNSHPYSGDTYVFNRGDGKDTITDYGYSSHTHGPGYKVYEDALRFGAGIAPADVSLQRSGNDMVFKVSETDQVTVRNWFVNSYQFIEQVQFADGSIWQASQVTRMASQPANQGTERIASLETVSVQDVLEADMEQLVEWLNASNRNPWASLTDDDLVLHSLRDGWETGLSGEDAAAQLRAEHLTLSENPLLVNSQIDALVQAMASFGAPPTGQTSFRPLESTSVFPMLSVGPY